MDGTREELSAIYRVMQPALAERAWASTVPVLAMQGERLAQHGTGTLFKIAETPFLVTAAHLFHQANLVNATLLLSPDIGRIHPLIPFGDVTVPVEPPQALGGYLFDVAVWKLDSEFAACLTGKTFLRLADIAVSGELGDDFYYVCGYPTELATVAQTAGSTVMVAPLDLTTRLFKGETGNLANYRPDLHVLLNADRTLVRDIDGDATPFPASLVGISGGSIWKANIAGGTLGGWNATRAKWVAVENGTYRNHTVIRGTRWGAVAELIFRIYPELKPACGIYLASRA